MQKKRVGIIQTDKNIAYRHGECCILKIDKLPKEAKATKEKVFARGSRGHDHSISSGILYKKDGKQYLKAENTNLLHPEHSPKVGDAKIEDGFYQIIGQVEYTPDGLVPVID